MKSPLVRNVLLTLGFGIFVTALCSWFSVEQVHADGDKAPALNQPATLSLKTDDYQPSAARDIKRNRELSGRRYSEAADFLPTLPKAAGFDPVQSFTSIHLSDLVRSAVETESGPEPYLLAFRQMAQPISSWKLYPILFNKHLSVNICTQWLIARMSGRDTHW